MTNTYVTTICYYFIYLHLFSILCQHLMNLYQLKKYNLNCFYQRVLDFISDILDVRMRQYSLLIPLTSINSCVLLLLLLLILLPRSYISNIRY